MGKEPKRVALTVSILIEAIFIYMASKTLFNEESQLWEIICAATGGGIFLILFLITTYRLLHIIRKKDNKKQ